MSTHDPFERGAPLTPPDTAGSAAGAGDIAIIGMAARLPGARSVDEFWRNLCAGVESITRLSTDHLLAAGLPAALAQDDHFVPVVSSLADSELFDAAFFGYQPREAELMDPQHRVLLELAWEALEDAGYRSGDPAAVIGAYVGAAANTYLLFHLTHGHDRESFDPMQVNLGNADDFLATRLSYKLNLTGPSLAVRTACSTSLVAVHLACQALAAGECDIALAGAATVNPTQSSGYRFVPGGILSPDGHCRTFDAQAAGTIFGSGAGIVVLKRLADAVAARDRIVAVIKGSAINNDGALKAGYTAPSVTGQAEVITEACAMAGISPRTIELVEAHGTATAIGDPIEIQALTQAYRAHTDARQFCAVGSVKTNIGHLDAAAGVAGLIKVALALQQGRMPPSLHFTQPNPEIDFAGSPFFVNTSLREWRRGAHPRRAALSAFGIGGTNAHLVLEEPPAPPPAAAGRPAQLVLLSARTPSALEAATDRLRRHLQEHPELDLDDVAYTLQVGRQSLAHRRAALCGGRDGRGELIERLGQPAALAPRTAHVAAETASPAVAFLFPGQGTQYAQMGRELYEHEPVFRAEIDRCCSALDPHLGRSLRARLLPAAADVAQADRDLLDTALAQPALFVVELALARLLLDWGVRPQMMLGHSLGEYVAACVAGVMATDDALAIVAARGRLMSAQAPGGMVAVPLGAERLAEELASAPAPCASALAIAAINAPGACVVSGPLDELAAFERHLAGRGVQGQRLQTSHAFHSPMMQPAADALARVLRGIKLHPPRVPFISNVTGTWITAADATSADYWARQLVAPARIGAGLQTLLDRAPILLEAGPGRVLSNLALLQGRAERPLAVPLMPGARQQEDAVAALWDGLGRLWLAGVAVDWEQAHAQARRSRVRLPTYPFERQRLWIERADAAPTGHASTAAASAIVRTHELPIAATRDSKERRSGSTLAALKEVVSQVCGVAAESIDPDAQFAQLGLNSMLLLQVNQAVHDQFRVYVPLRQYFEDCSSIAALAACIDQQAPSPDEATAPDVPVDASRGPARVEARAESRDTAKAHGEAAVAVPAGRDDAGAVTAAGAQTMVEQQLALISEQLDLLRRSIAGGLPPDAAAVPTPASASRAAAESARSTTLAAATAPASTPIAAPAAIPARTQAAALAATAAAAALNAGADAPPSTPASQPFTPYARLNLDANPGFVRRQQEHLRALVARYTAKTARSRAAIETDRAVLANNRAVAGFRLALKELTYPIIAREAAGARFRDLDDNEYIDISMGFGVYLFGHHAPFIDAAVARELRRGAPIGPFSHEAGHVARRIGELTGVERVAFFNTGTEAVMVAVRLARARTGRSKIAIFAGSFHGTFDGILARPRLTGGGRMDSAPLAPGIPQHMTDHIVMLEYGSQSALDAIAAQAGDLAAVLVEPVQSRRPDFQPVAFLQQLRDVTRAAGTALIFDEMISGFRIAPGGVQAHFGVQADLVTYGKVIGGGMPIGIVAGTASFMDGIDGGVWTFGDGSYPSHEERRTFVAGTFCQHPLAMSAASAVLDHLTTEGPDLQRRLNARTESLTSRLNAWFTETDVPLRMVHFGSLFRFVPRGDLELLFYHLVEKGIYIWEGRNCFLSTAHTDADIERIIAAVRESVEELRDGGFLPGRAEPRPGERAAAAVARETSRGELAAPSGVRREQTPAVPAAPTHAQASVHQQAQAHATAAPPADPAVVPLTDEQKQLWVVTQLSPAASVAYNEGVALRLRGPFDREALRWALQRIYERHEALRTVIDRDGETQRVMPPAAFDLGATDLTGRADDGALTEWLAAEGSRPFDLAAGPLVRAQVVDLGPDDHLFFFLVHHIIADDWSRIVLLEELGAFYTARRTGRPIALPAPVPFRAFVAWQQKQLADRSAAAVRERTFWQERLAPARPGTAAPAAFELPADRRPTPARQFPGARLTRTVAPDLATAVGRLAVQRRATPYAVLLSVFAALLARISQQAEVVIGMSAAGQPVMQASTLVGQCISVLPLRLAINEDPDDSFAAWLAAVRRTLLDAVEHQGSYLAAVVQARQQGVRMPDATVMFNLDHPVAIKGFDPAVAELISFPVRYAKFDLSLNAIEIDGTLRLEFDYRTDLFDEQTIDGWSRQFVSLLGRCVATPDSGLDDLLVLSPGAAAEDEGSQRLDAREPRERSGGAELDVATLIARQAARTPAAIAIAASAADTDASGDGLTYADLDRLASAFAKELTAFGAHAGARVLLDADSLSSMAVHLLGVLKAGCAFARVARGDAMDEAILREIDIVVTARGGGRASIRGVGALASMGMAVASEPAEAPRQAPVACVLHRGDAASPGAASAPRSAPPIALSHAFLAAHAQAIAERLRLQPGDRVSHVGASSGADLPDVLLDVLLPALITGATVVDGGAIEPPHDGEALRAYIERQQVTVVDLTLGQWRRLGATRSVRASAGVASSGVDSGVNSATSVAARIDDERAPRAHPHQHPRVRCLVRGSVAATAAQVVRWGPTDTDRMDVCYGYMPAGCPMVVGIASAAPASPASPNLADSSNAPDLPVAVSESPRPAAVDPRAFPVIEPLTPTTASVRDARRRPVWPGAIGELCIDTGAALQRTGVRARVLFDGRLQVLAPVHASSMAGARDRHPDDLVGVLMAHPLVRDAAVSSVPLAGTDRTRIAAFCVLGAEAPSGRSSESAADARIPRDSASLTRALQPFLREHLPEPLVPAVCVPVDALPLRDDGTVDAARLPVDAIGDVAGAHAPRGEVEEQLAAIWQRLLNVARLDTRNNFFELGGHSLVAIALAAEVRAAFGVPLTLRELFDAPTIAQMAALIAPRRRAGDDAAMSREALVRVTADPANADRPFPLTDVQQAYWVGRTGAFGLGNVATHAYYEVDATAVDLDRFAAAWRRLIARHGMLRAIIQPDGQQQILPDVPPYEIVVTDLTGRDADTVAAGLAAIRARMSHQVMPSDRWPLFEIQAARWSATQVRLYFSLDALILDAWSMQILFRELSRLYQDPTADLVPLEVSFRDYLVAHRELERGEAFREAQAYWQRRRSTLPAAPDLPLARDPASIDQPRFVRWAGRLEAETWAQLKIRASRSSMTPSIVLLAAYAEVLAMWSKSPQFAINLTLFNRLPLHPQVNDLVGDFTSVTLLAVDGQPHASFAQRARRVQEQFWEDLDHHLVSGVRVLRDMARARNNTSGLQMPVVFTSSLIHGQERLDEAPMAWLGEVVYSVTQTPQVWLDHEVYEDGQALVFTWDVVADLFPEGVIPGMFDAFTTLLARLADSDAWWDAPWPEVHRQLLPAAQADLLARANDTQAPIADVLLQSLFADQVRARPTQTAIVTSGLSMSYEELHRRAARLGRTLRDAGARPNRCIAIVMAKGWEQIVAALGILEAGAAYLPIDPSLPRERLLHLLAHAEVSLVLTQQRFDASLPWPPGVRRICVDRADLDQVDASPLAPAQRPEDLAYVIFTSGSTGLPKGVMIDHRGAVNTILDVNRRYGVGPADRVLALSSLSFDLSVWDIFGLLAAGGTIVVPDEDTTRDPAHWVALVRRAGVTIWNSVPALMQMLIEYSDAAAAFTGSLRLVMMSGDWIPVTLPDRIRALAPDIRLAGLGGATEASIWSIAYDIDRVDPAWTSIPYGRPMVNQTWHVLDAALEPRPVWTPGHLYIGGIGLAKGYWRDDEKTRASFVTHPRTGETLYRTGDLGRWLPDGTIEFLGREDTQVKVQGHRIELGEIEAALLQHPTVQSAVVAAVGDRTGDKRLIAYVVPAPAPPRDGGDLAATELLARSTEPITDPIAQLRFKLSEPGLRADIARQGIALPDANEPPEANGDAGANAEAWAGAAADGDAATSGNGASRIDRTIGYIERRSYRTFAGERLQLAQLGELLSCLRQWRLPEAPLPKYRYGSAGSLYAVQLYVGVMPSRVDGLDAGIYYYDPRDHRLLPLAADTGDLRDLHELREIYEPTDRTRFDQAGVALFLIGDISVVERLYPESGTRFALIEAGLMTQLLETTGPAAGIGLCQIGRVDFDRVRPRFSLGGGHMLLNALVAGAILPSQRLVGALLDDVAGLRPLVAGAQAIDEDRVPAGAGHADPREVWRAWLRQKVPAYMVPADFVSLDALPLSGNGKVDRAALPAPRESGEAPRLGFVAARTDLERQLVKVLQGILGIERIGVHDSFFELGGNSVHLVQFHNHLERVIGTKIPITAVFQHVTLSALSEYLVGLAPAASADRTETVAIGAQRLAQLLQRSQA